MEKCHWRERGERKGCRQKGTGKMEGEERRMFGLF